MFFKTGPTREQVNTRGFKYWAIAYSYKNKLPKDEQHTSPHELKTTVRVDGPDSAYAGTSALIVAAARTIVLEPNALPTDGGIYSPGACFGSNIIDRLNGRGVTFNVIQRNHILSSEISTRVTTLQTEFDRLQTLWEEKKRLHDLRLDAQQWHRDAPEMENWVKQREQYLRDGWKEASSVEDIEDIIRQHEDLPTTMDVNDAKIRSVIQFGDRLCQDNNYTVDKIHKKARNTEERRNANRGKALSTPEALKDALALQQFLSDCEELREWPKTVHFKSMRHQAFDSEIMSNKDRLKKLQEAAVRLSSEKPKLMPHIDPQWDEPERTAKEKGEKLFNDGPEVTRSEDLPRQHRLAESEKAHSFLYDSNEAEAWMSEQELYMMTDEHDKNDFSTENMVKKHERVQSDINAYGYADTIRELGERAQTLIDTKAPLNDQTAIRPPQADKLYTGLQDLSRERCHRLDETLQLFDRHREIDDLEHWITEREVVAASQELGQDLEHAQMLQERFRQFARDTKTIGTERVSRVNEQRDQMIASGHKDAPTIAPWKDSLNGAWENLLELVDTRTQMLAAWAQLHKFFHDSRYTPSRILEKNHSIPDDLGRDTSSVNKLLRKHQNFLNDLQPIETQVRQIQSDAQSLQATYVGDKALEIQAREAEVVNAWRNLQGATEGRRMQLADTSDLFRFLNMVRVLRLWMEGVKREMNTQDKTRDASGVELLMNSHQSRKAEIDAREENFNVCINLGRDLLARKHYALSEVEKKPIKLTTKRANASRLMRKDGAEFLFSAANEQEMDDWMAKKTTLLTEPVVPSETATVMEADLPEPDTHAIPQQKQSERPLAPSSSCVVGQ